MQRWLVRLAAVYAGTGAVVYMLYRAAYLRTLDVRAWTERGNRELLMLRDELRAELAALRQRRADAPLINERT
jgi:hypothetical protein